MLVITEKIREILKEKNISQNELARKIDYKHGTFGTFVTGKSAFPDPVIEKIAPILGVSADKIRGWILVNKCSREVIERAIKAKKEKQDNKLILTTKIDEILKSKNISRTSLSKIIDYSQGSLNEMIINKKPISKSVILKLSVTLEIPEDKIKSWIVADKYSLESLEVALREL